VEALERIRTKGRALERVVELVEEQTRGKTPVRLATLHANALEDAQSVLEKATQRVGAVESILTEVSPVVGTHAGPGTVGLAYMAGM
jgi:fatty acid-binding protein DegV